jgi:transcriptional regulator with XRE-family HTH domain
MPDHKPTFASHLTRLREAAGLSKYRLARLAGLSTQALSNLELGAREPTWVTVQRLASALGVSCEEFTDPGLVLPPGEPPGQPGRPRKQAADTAPKTTVKPSAKRRKKQ